MFSFFSKNEKDKYSLIIDIQSGLVRSALIHIKSDGSHIIKKVITKIIPRKSHTNSNYINKMMIKALSESLTAVIDNKRIENINVILSSPWVLSHSKTVRIDFGKDTEITQGLISGLIDIERKKLEKEFSVNHKNIPEFYNDLKYIEQKIFDIKLNGYSVTQYIGRTVKDFTISLAMTLSSKIILGRIESTIKKDVFSKKIKFHSGLLLNFTALRKMMADKNDYVYIHAHSELTDVIVVKRGQCANISSFPLGTSSLVRMTAHVLKQEIEVADSMISLYQGKKLEEAEANRIKLIVDIFGKNWIALYNKILDTSIDIGGIPRLIFLSTHSHADLFKDIVIASAKEEMHIIDFNLENMESDITFEKNSEQNQLIKMYALALVEDMI